MKNTVIICMLLLSSVVFAQTKNFTISGDIQGFNVKKMFTYIPDKSSPDGYISDEIVVQNGKFFYSMSVDKMTHMSWLPMPGIMKRMKGGFYPGQLSNFQFFAFPGGKIHISGKITDFVDAYPSGDPANNDLAQLNKQIVPRANEIANLAIKIADSVISDEVDVAHARKRIEELEKQQNEIKHRFLKKKKRSVAAAWLLSDMITRSAISNNAAITFFEKMDKRKLGNTPFYLELAKRIEGIKMTSIGSDAPQIKSKNTYSGKAFDLSLLRGKYVILDFWGTWCGPCVAGMSKMKEQQDKYKGRLEIVGIANESDDGSRWRAFLDNKPEYQWEHVLSRPGEDYILKYSIAGYPTKIIIDPNGKILGRFVGEDKGFYDKLGEFLK